MSYGDFTFELSQFAIQCGNNRYVYDYRPGMSFSDWACSELNTDGWIPWYGDAVLSPDKGYICTTGYLDMREFMESEDTPNYLVAKEYDGNTNYMNNDNVVADFSAAGINGEEIDIDDIDFSNGGKVIVLEPGQDLEDILSQGGFEDMPGIPVDGATGENPIDEIMAAFASEEREIAEKGNISVSVAHMVNARTPLFTPGFRIISKEDGFAAYHSVEMGIGDYLFDDILDIYMNGIADELIPHIKLYAFPESQEFLDTLEGHTILNAHPTPLEQGNEMLTIPENAVCLTFQRVPDGQEAPNSPNPRKPGHENLNQDAVYARYVTKDDPNFGEGVNLVFAITFDDELVYWIHMGSHFQEKVDTEWIVNVLPY